MTVDTQKPEVKGTAQHQEFAPQDAQNVDNFPMKVMEDGEEEDLKPTKNERVYMTDEQVSYIFRTPSPSTNLVDSRAVWSAGRLTAPSYRYLYGEQSRRPTSQRHLITPLSGYTFCKSWTSHVSGTAQRLD